MTMLNSEVIMDALDVGAWLFGGFWEDVYKLPGILCIILKWYSEFDWNSGVDIFVWT